MRSIALLMAAFALSAEAPPPDLRQFDEAIKASHFRAAAAVVDKLIAQRAPIDGQPRQDALLNALLGRLLVAAHQAGAGATFLAHANLADLPPSFRVETALVNGGALELKGDRNGALAAYRAAAGGSGAPDEQRQAALGIARQLIVTDTAAARDQVMAIANGPENAERWEARYLLAASSSLAKDAATAARFAEGAWADSATAPPNRLAPLHVAMLRAGLAAARNDTTAERAMLIVTNGLSASASDSLGGQLPVCGDDGISSSDYVIFGFVSGPYDTRNLIPIAASRPAVVATFYDHLANAAVIKTSGSSPIGTVFTVSCRNVVSQNYVASRPSDDPLLDWFVARGLYPATASNDPEDANVNAVAARIDALSAKFGKDNILLIEPRWQLMTMLETRAVTGDTVPPGQLADLATQIADGLRRAGAPAWLAQSVEARSKYTQLAATASDRAQQMSAMEGFIRDQMLNAPIEMARLFVTGMLSSSTDDELPAPASRLIIDLHHHAPNAFAGRERQAWLSIVAGAQHSLGMEAEARATIASAGFARDLCVNSDSELKLLEQHFSYNDYPDELIAGEQEGTVLFEFDLSSAGAPINPHIVYSLPSGIFDAPSAKGIGTIRYTPPTRAGKIASCRGIFQPLIWRLEQQNEFSVPTLQPGVANPTT